MAAIFVAKGKRPLSGENVLNCRHGDEWYVWGPNTERSEQHC